MYRNRAQCALHTFVNVEAFKILLFGYFFRKFEIFGFSASAIVILSLIIAIVNQANSLVMNYQYFDNMDMISEWHQQHKDKLNLAQGFKRLRCRKKVRPQKKWERKTT